MTTTSYQINFKPDKSELEQLSAWMMAENRQNTGLVHYIDIPANHAAEGTLATISFENETIGYVTWDIYMHGSHISVAAVAPEHRRSGAGRFLMNALFKHLADEQILAIHLECAPASSEPFWRSLGFQTMPEISGYSDGDEPCLYKTLVESQEQAKPKGEYIQVNEWGSPKKMTWTVVYKPGTTELVKPIIIPASGDWQIAHVKNVPPEHPDKVKYFQSGRCYHAPFLILTRL